MAYPTAYVLAESRIKGAEMTPFRKPRWAKKMDAVNFSIVGIIMLLVLWETFRRWLGF